MSILEKAKLQEITDDGKDTPVGDAIPVQFNPTTLKLQITNSLEGGDADAAAGASTSAPAPPR